MIAYLFWHCAYQTTAIDQYEEALMRFQQRLGQQQPPGFGGSASFRIGPCPGSAIGRDMRIGAC
jgi:hypothetical protein